MKPKRHLSRWRIPAISFVVFLLVALAAFALAHRRVPRGLVKDLRAGIAARDKPDADQRLRTYLELRYGPLSDPANREKVFLDFFNVEHIKALQILVKYSPRDHRQANILATAKWLKNYRETMTPEERSDLSAQILSDQGRTMLRQSMAEYNSQDVYYRGDSVPVTSQLMETLAALQKR